VLSLEELDARQMLTWCRPKQEKEKVKPVSRFDQAASVAEEKAPVTTGKHAHCTPFFTCTPF